MMTHDPFQNYQAFGAYPGLPYTAFQNFVNPAANAGQLLSNPGIGYGSYPQPGIYPQTFQGAGLQGPGIAGQQGFGQPLPASYPSLQNPLLQHQLAQGLWQNPLLAASLQNQMLNPMIGYHTWPQQQQQFTYPLAPQSLIGAGGIGLPFGQIHPLAHAALRQAAGYGYPAVPGYF